MADTHCSSPSAHTVLGDLAMEQLRATVRWATACPDLTVACESWLKATAVHEPPNRIVAGDMVELPLMTKTQAMEAASEHLRARPGQYLLSSGSTGRRTVRALAALDDYSSYEHTGNRPPLQAGDVLLNCYPAGGAYLHTERHAERRGIYTVPAGSDLRQVAEMADQLRDIGVTVAAGYPRTLATLAEHLLDQGAPLNLRAALWTGEHMTPGIRAALREPNPRIELWGSYSSSESGCVAVGFPTCTPGTFHLCPNQLLELSPAACLLTRAAESGTDRPALRMPLGDTLAAVRCDCPNPRPAVRVIERTDRTIRLHATDLPIDSLWLAAADSPEITGAQLLAVPADPTEPEGTMLRLGLRVQPRATRAPDPVGTARRAADRTLARHPKLRALVSHTPDALFTEAALLELLSTGKTRPLVMLAPDL
ncbi:hypothetical protein [Embleya sp. MST-111070]|uniref:hypothetical protein n=1 Tax=Embleya sp. MST-111070 TaxID=3398231 RepID=UPI003F73271A